MLKSNFSYCAKRKRNLTFLSGSVYDVLVTRFTSLGLFWQNIIQLQVWCGCHQNEFCWLLGAIFIRPGFEPRSFSLQLSMAVNVTTRCNHVRVTWEPSRTTSLTFKHEQYFLTDSQVTLDPNSWALACLISLISLNEGKIEEYIGSGHPQLIP